MLSASHHCSCFSSQHLHSVCACHPTKIGVDCSLPDAWHKDGAGWGSDDQRGGHVLVMWSCPSRTGAPQGAYLSKLGLELNPLASSLSSLDLRPAQTHEPLEPFGKNQCYGWQAAGPCFTGLHRIPATTRAFPQLQAPEKMLLSEPRAQSFLVQATELTASTGGFCELTSWAGNPLHFTQGSDWERYSGHEPWPGRDLFFGN